MESFLEDNRTVQIDLRKTHKIRLLGILTDRNRGDNRMLLNDSLTSPIDLVFHR